MSATIPRLKPRSLYVQCSQGRYVRILNQSTAGLPAERLRQIVDIARGYHDKRRAHSSEPMESYTYGDCHSAALIVRSRAVENIRELEDTDIIRGVNVPGSLGYYHDLKGIHHLTALYFREQYVAVDVTVSQLGWPNGHYGSTEALIIATDPDYGVFSDSLSDAYQGGKWEILIFGF